MIALVEQFVTFQFVSVGISLIILVPILIAQANRYRRANQLKKEA